MSHIHLGTNLKALLRQRGLTLREVSTRTGIPYSTLHTWLDNRQPRDIVKVKILADHLAVSLHLLLFGEEQSLRPEPGLPQSSPGEIEIYEITVRRKPLP